MRSTRGASLAWAILASVAMTAPAIAQSPSTSGAARIAVQAVVAVRALSAPREVAREQGGLNASSDVVVDANTRYLLRVRLAHEPVQGVHVLVRDTAGVFQPLMADGAVAVAVEQQRGRTAHTISCRIEGANTAAMQAGACALAYDWFTLDGATRIFSVSGG